MEDAKKKLSKDWRGEAKIGVNERGAGARLRHRPDRRGFKCDSLCLEMCVKGHQESNLTL
jgi:hypothetical protein